MASKKGGKGGSRGLPPVNHERINSGKKQTNDQIIDKGNTWVKEGQFVNKILMEEKNKKSELKFDHELKERRPEVKENLQNREKIDNSKEIVKENLKDEPDKDH